MAPIDQQRDPRQEDEVPQNGLVFGIALFGLGRAGTIHLVNLLRNARTNLLYIVELDTRRSDQVKTELGLGDAITFLKPDEADLVYKDPKVDACIIASPTFTHEKLIVDSLRAGKAVLSEKPLGEDISTTRRVYEVAEEVRKPLLCAFNRRFDASFGEAREAVRTGDLGQVRVVKTVSRDSPLPSMAYLKISGGIFHDCAVHDVDLITWILGELPNKVYCSANSKIPEIGDMDDFDNVSISLMFPSGAFGLVDINRYASYGYDQRLEVFGSKGMMKVDNDSPNQATFYDSSGEKMPPMFYSFASRHANGYINELNHFLDVVQGQGELSVTKNMTLAVSKITTAIEDSARCGKPIHLEWDKEEMPSF